MPDRAVWFVLPWSPQHQGGVTGVVKHLQRGFAARAGTTAEIVVNEWLAARPHRGDDGALHFRFQAFAVENVRGLLASLVRLPLALWRTWRLLRQHQVQAVNFHYTDHSAAVLLLLRRLGLWRGTVALSFHGTDVRLAAGRVARWLHRRVLLAADARVACSNSLADRLAATFGLARETVDVVFNGADLAVFRPEAPLTPRLAGQLPTEYIASVGAFIPRKAHNDLVSAFVELAPRLPALHLCLAGADGSDMTLVKERIAAAGLQHRVHLFVGLAPGDVAALLARARLCVQAALAESFPLAVLEAGAVGVPVVVSAIAGHDELVFEGSTGRLFEARNPAACATVIERALADAEGTRAMADRLAARVRSELSWDRCVERYASVLLPQGRA